MNTISKIVRGNQSSFFWLMQLLPKAQRVGAYTIFAFNHHIEKEIVKSLMDKAEKKEMLVAWQKEIDNIFDENKVPQTEIGRKIYKNCMRFDLKKEMFVKVIDGYMQSLSEPFFNPSLAEYERYCNDVYGARIEMGLKIFGQDDVNIAKLMAEFIHPVVALENMKEDCHLGFVFMPKEFLQKADVAITTPQEILINPKLAEARSMLLDYSYKKLYKIEEYYPKIDKQTLKLIRGFVNIYKKYLVIMQTRGMEVITPKPLISNISKMKIILKSMLG